MLLFLIVGCGRSLQHGLGHVALRVHGLRQGRAVGGSRVLGQVERAFLAASSQQCRTGGKDNRLAYNLRNSQHRHIVMNDLEYLGAAEALLLAVEQTCDRINDDTDADIDAQRVGGLVTLTFPNRSQIIINLQPPLHEVWLAAKSGGYHYKFDGQAWRDTKTGNDFYVDLSRDATVQSGMKLAFSA